MPPALSQPTGHALERDVAARPKSPPLSPLRPGSATRARRCRSTAARGCSSGRLRCRSVRRPTTCPMPEGRDATALRLTPPPYVGVGTCPHIGLSTARSSSCQDHNPRTTTTVVAVANRSGRAAWRRRDVAQEAGKTLPGAGVRARYLTPPFSGPEQDQRLGVHRVAAVSTAHALVRGVAATLRRKTPEDWNLGRASNGRRSRRESVLRCPGCCPNSPRPRRHRRAERRPRGIHRSRQMNSLRPHGSRSATTPRGPVQPQECPRQGGLDEFLLVQLVRRLLHLRRGDEDSLVRSRSCVLASAATPIEAL